MKEISIRPACLWDIPRLLEIEKLSFLPCDRFNENQFLYAIKKGKGTLAIKYERPILGCFDIIHGYIYMSNKSRIYSLAVHPLYRNNKSGYELLAKMEEIYKPFGQVRLEVRKDNIKAIHFYTKNGYISCGIRQNYYKDGMDAIVMKKDLSNAKRRLAESCDTL